jgi:hypothetical protein
MRIGLGFDTTMLHVSLLVRRLLAGIGGVKRVSSMLAKL